MCARVLSIYVKQLGFSIDWDEGGMASVTRDRCTIFLCEWEQGQRGTWAWIGVRDVEAFHQGAACAYELSVGL